MSKNRKIQKVLVALIVGTLCSAPFWSFAQNEKGVTRGGESTKAIGSSKAYVNEFGKLVCWPRVNANGKLLTYGPIVDTEGADDITTTTATLKGNILHDGWCSPITEQGFEVSTSEDFTTIVKTVKLTPVPTFTPCATYPACSCNDNKYSKEVSGLQPGVKYYYRAYAKNNCGTGYGDTLNFTTDNDFVVTVTGPDSYTFCITGSESATYTASIAPTMAGATYQWYLDGTKVSGATSATYTTTYTQASAGSHTVKCEVTVTALTRDGSKATTVTVNNPTVNFSGIGGNLSLCHGASTTLTANASASTGATLSYQWQKDGVNITDATAATYTATTAGTYGCEITATQSGCSSAPATKTVVVTEIITEVADASITPDASSICAGSNVTLIASASVSSGATMSYQWKKNGTSIPSATSATYAATEAGTYTCVITATQGTCSASQESAPATVTVTTPSVGTITLAGTTICANSTATLTPTITGSMGTLSYQWTTTGGTPIVDATSANYITPELTATTTYTLNVTAVAGSCSATGSATATVTVDGPYEAKDTIQICDCLLKPDYKYTVKGYTFTWADAAEVASTPTKSHIFTTAAGCDSVVYITLETWSSGAEKPTACANILNGRSNEIVDASGNLTKVKDFDNNEYSVVQIGDQCWMKQNLRVKHFADGTALVGATSVNEGHKANIYYTTSNNIYSKGPCDDEHGITMAQHTEKYGLMYNWYTAMHAATDASGNAIVPDFGLSDVQGICPEGWHLPDTAEWQTLERSAGFYGQHSETDHIFVGNSAIQLVTGCEWKKSTVAGSPGDYSAFGRNATNFSVRPAGCFLDVAHDVDGTHYNADQFAYVGIWAFFWSSNRYDKPGADIWVKDEAAYNYDITFDKTGIARDVNEDDYKIGRSVRCVRDKSSLKVRIDATEEAASGTSYTVTGNVYDLGSTTCAERGVVYGTSHNPTISNTKVTSGSGSGTYTCNVPVTAGTTYYVRAYAKDAANNIVYSNEIAIPMVCPSTTVTIDGDQYATVAIGNQCWTRHSLHATHYADGTAIAMGSPVAGDVYSETTAYYYTPYTNRGTLPSDAAGRINVWGYLYNWAAATNNGTLQGICPNGWHVPTLADWNTLDNYVTSRYGCSGGSAKALAYTNTWSNSEVTEAMACAPGHTVSSNNASGFGAYPVGIYNPTKNYVLETTHVNFWASDNYYTTFSNKSTNLDKVNLSTLANGKQFAFSVRCVKD